MLYRLTEFTPLRPWVQCEVRRGVTMEKLLVPTSQKPHRCGIIHSDQHMSMRVIPKSLNGDTGFIKSGIVYGEGAIGCVNCVEPHCISD